MNGISSQVVQPPKVLLVGPSFSGGGAEKRFRNICSKLFGGKVDICLFKSDSTSSSGICNKNLTDLRWRSEYSYPRIILTLTKIIRRGKYDAVMGFGLFPNLVAWLATCLCTERPSLILTEITRPWMAFSNQPKGLKRTFLRILHQAAYRCADVMAANSTDGVIECIHYFNVREDKIKRLPNVVNVNEIMEEAMAQDDLQWLANKMLITVASRLDRMKRIDTLLDAVSLLPTDIDWALIILGDGPELYKLERQAIELAIENQVIFHGWIENPLPVIKLSTVYVMCSEYEGFSNSVLEAMFLGVPVITSLCTTDARKMCEEGAAMGFEVGDAKSLSRLLLELFKSRQKRQSLVQAARRYSTRHECSQAIPVYEQMILRVVMKMRSLAE